MTTTDALKNPPQPELLGFGGAGAQNLADARAFLAMLMRGHTFQAFHDKGRNTALAKTLHGTLADLAPTLIRLNNLGAGIFVAVNEIAAGAPRTTENVTRVRALFADADKPERVPEVEEAIVRLLPPPSIVVETSPGKRHFYWLTADCPLDRFTETQKALATSLGTDPVVCDLPRVARLPGFIHHKGAPFRSRLLHASPTTYPFTELASRLAVSTAPAAAKTTTTVVEPLGRGSRPSAAADATPSRLNAEACSGLVNIDEIEAAAAHYPLCADYTWWRDNWLFPIASAVALAPEHADRLRQIFDRENRRTADPAKASDDYFASAMKLLEHAAANG